MKSSADKAMNSTGSSSDAHLLCVYRAVVLEATTLDAGVTAFPDSNLCSPHVVDTSAFRTKTANYSPTRRSAWMMPERTRRSRGLRQWRSRSEEARRTEGRTPSISPTISCTKEMHHRFASCGCTTLGTKMMGLIERVSLLWDVRACSERCFRCRSLWLSRVRSIIVQDGLRCARGWMTV